MPTAQQKINLVQGTPFFEEFKGDSIPGSQQTLIDITVPANTTKNLSMVRVVSRAESLWELFEGGNILASGRTGPGHVTDEQIWQELRPVGEGKNIKLMFKQVANTPILPVEAYLTGSDQTN